MRVNKALLYRRGAYAAIILFAVGLWMPHVGRMVGDWQESRRLRRNIAILYTVDTRGFLENCGCEHAMAGSLPTRHGFIAAQRQLRPNLLLVDSGNTVEDTRRLEILMTAMAMDGYDAVGTGEAEPRLGEAFLKSAREHKIRLVRALPCGDALDPLTERFRTRQLAGHTFGVTAAPPPPAGQSYDAYRDRLIQAIRELRHKCEVLILLSQLGLERDRDLARRCGDQGPHLLVGNLDARVLHEPEQIGSSVLVPTAPGGSRVGSADVVFPFGGAPRIEHVEIQEAAGEPEPRLHRMILDYYAATEKLFLKDVDSRLLVKAAGQGAGDVARCGKCHEKEAKHWRRSRHAEAILTLIYRHRMVPECVPCHASHFRDSGVFDKEARAGSVDCTACHPVARAGESSACPEKATRTRGPETCVTCHNIVHNPHFNYVEKIPWITHTQDQPLLSFGPP